MSQFLLEECLSRGVHLHHPAEAISIHTDVHGELASVRVAETSSSTETDIPCTRILISAGAWSPEVFSTLFKHSKLKLPVSKLAGHSLVLKSPRWSKEEEERGCHAVYTSSPAGFSPEIFSRLGGHIYLAGLNSTAIPLPKLASDAQVSSAAVASLKQMAQELLGGDGDADDLEVVREALCFRPITSSGVPFITRIPDEKLGVGVSTRPGADGGVFLAAGHGPWGISHSLGTGIVMAELMQGRQLSADIGSLALR